MSMRRSVAIVGAGIGSEHLVAYQALPDRFSVHTVCERDEPRAQLLIDRSPGTRFADNIEAVIANPEIDIVDICLPPHLHYDICVLALKAGKHVICEKPLVASVRDADRLMALSEKMHRSVFPVFQYRYGLGGLQMRELIDTGLAGKAFAGSLETHWNRGPDYYSPEWRGSWAGEQGGAVLNHAIHIHDWLSFVFGPVASVYAEVATRVNDIEVEDCAALSIRMCNGALVTSSITLGAANDSTRLRFCFNGLTAQSGLAPYAPAEDQWTFTARAPFEQLNIDNTLASLSATPSGYVGLFTALANSLDGQQAQQVTLADGRRSLEFVSAVYSSARRRQPVALPLTAEHESYGGWMPDVSPYPSW